MFPEWVDKRGLGLVTLPAGHVFSSPASRLPAPAWLQMTGRWRLYPGAFFYKGQHLNCRFFYSNSSFTKSGLAKPVKGLGIRSENFRSTSVVHTVLHYWPFLRLLFSSYQEILELHIDFVFSSIKQLPLGYLVHNLKYVCKRWRIQQDILHFDLLLPPRFEIFEILFFLFKESLTRFLGCFF